MEHSFFTKKLLEWNKNHNSREMPWKNEKDPYKIWLSEIILQQTRVEQGWDYYNKFIQKYPDVQKLANADDNEVFKLWEGLGYYNRCKNLIATARFISNELKGKFPTTHQDILGLKGVGPYTAAAIASFAYGLPFAVVDGNVTRVLSRFFGISTPIDSTKGKKEFDQLAQLLIDKKIPGVYNQAIMDFGATICKPKSPLCMNCNLTKTCKAFNQNKINEFPQKIKSIAIKERRLYYLVLSYKQKIYVGIRSHKDVWQNLHEFILLAESEKKEISTSDLIEKTKVLLGGGSVAGIKISNSYKQQLTHQTIHCIFIQLDISKQMKFPQYKLVDIQQIRNIAFPKVIVNYMNQEMLS